MVALSLELKSQDIVFDYSYEESDIRDAFTLLGVSNFKYKMPKAFKGFYFDLIVKEYYEGKEIGSTSEAPRFEKMKKVLQ